MEEDRMETSLNFGMIFFGNPSKVQLVLDFLKEQNFKIVYLTRSWGRLKIIPDYENENR